MPFVLAIEPDPRQATTLKRVVKAQVRAELLVVDSKDRALTALASRIPDLILVTALLPPRDEDQLTGYLKTLDGAGHLQTLTIPLFASAPAEDHGGKRVFGGLKRKRRAPVIQGCDPKVFGEQVEAYVARAVELRAEAAALADYQAREREAAAQAEREAAEREAIGGQAEPAEPEQQSAYVAPSFVDRPVPEYRPPIAQEQEAAVPVLEAEAESQIAGAQDAAADSAPEPVVAWEPVLVSEPDAVVASQPEPVVASEPDPAIASEPEPAIASEPEPAVASELEPVVAPEPEAVAPLETEPITAPESEPRPARDQALESMVAGAVPSAEPETAAQYAAASEAEQAVEEEPAPSRPQLLDDVLASALAAADGEAAELPRNVRPQPTGEIGSALDARTAATHEDAEDDFVEIDLTDAVESISGPAGFRAAAAALFGRDEVEERRPAASTRVVEPMSAERVVAERVVESIAPEPEAERAEPERVAIAAAAEAVAAEPQPIAPARTAAQPEPIARATVAAEPERIAPEPVAAQPEPFGRTPFAAKPITPEPAAAGPVETTVTAEPAPPEKHSAVHAAFARALGPLQAFAARIKTGGKTTATQRGEETAPVRGLGLDAARTQPAIEQPAAEQPAIARRATAQPVVEQPAAARSPIEQVPIEQAPIEKAAVEQAPIERAPIEPRALVQPAMPPAQIEQPAIAQPAFEKATSRFDTTLVSAIGPDTGPAPVVGAADIRAQERVEGAAHSDFENAPVSPKPAAADAAPEPAATIAASQPARSRGEAPPEEAEEEEKATKKARRRRRRARARMPELETPPVGGIDNRFIADALAVLRLDIEKLRHDAVASAAIERQRAAHEAPPVEVHAEAEPPETAPASAPGADGNGNGNGHGAIPPPASEPEPVQDEWGFYDPGRCGMQALMAKLDADEAAAKAKSAGTKKPAMHKLVEKHEETGAPRQVAPDPPRKAPEAAAGVDKRLAPLSMWAHVPDTRGFDIGQLLAPEPSSEVLPVTAPPGLADQVASVRYASGCRIHRVKVAPGPRPRKGDKRQVVILSRKALRKALKEVESE